LKLISFRHRKTIVSGLGPSATGLFDRGDGYQEIIIEKLEELYNMTSKENWNSINMERSI
jgi:hypothetical protein